MTQLQILSHEYAIASKIELFVSGFPLASITGPVEDVEFKRLGHFSLDSNERSNWQSRELKSVYVDVYLGLLKLVIHAPHKNKLNTKFQVGIMSVSCLGDVVDEQEEIDAYPSVDACTRTLLAKCMSEHQIAIRSINPEQAKLVQERIEFLLKSGAEILHMESLKLQAVRVEDYDEAKRFKLEIERIRDSQTCENTQFRSVTDVADPTALPLNFEKDNASLISALGKETVELLLSRDWKVREKVILELSRKPSPNEFGLEWIINKFIDDKIVNVFLAVCQIIQIYTPKQSSSTVLETALIHLVEQRMSDSNKRVADATVATILSMVPRLVPLSLACNHLLKGPFSKQTVAAKTLVIVGLLGQGHVPNTDLLVTMLGQWTECSVYSESIVCILKKLLDQIGETKVRLAIDVIDSKRWRLNLLHELSKAIGLLEKRTTEIGECEFCQETSPDFQTAKLLDMHYWEQCPNLIECHYCDQIIELTALSEHRLKECK